MAEPQQSRPRAPRSILLADDQDLVRTTIRMLLEHRGYKVTEAVDGIDAVEKYQQASPSFEAVILDVDMPRLNGIDALARIRQQDPKAPVILLSGMVHDLNVGEAVMLQKPFSNDELVEAIRQATQGN